MYENNVFAVLTPVDIYNKASSAFKLPHNSRWLHKAVGGVAEEAIMGSREITPAEDDEAQADAEKLSAVDRLVITFDEVDNPFTGIQLGTSTVWSHVLLGHRGTKGVSAKQCNITVDDDLHIWLHDYTSTHGTAVRYRHENTIEERKKETWILAFAPGSPITLGNISIHVGRLEMNINFPNHLKGDHRYIENLRAFVKRCKEAAEKDREVPAVEGLGLDSGATTQAPSRTTTQAPSRTTSQAHSGATTQAPSVIQTPRENYERLVYIKDRCIGKGTFGQVFTLIRARDGKIFAGKTFVSPANKRGGARGTLNGSQKYGESLP